MWWLIITLILLYVLPRRRKTTIIRSKEKAIFIENTKVNSKKNITIRRAQPREKNNISVKNIKICPIEYIEFPRIYDNGKILFMDNNGNGLSTERIAQHYYKNLGYNVVRGEVLFWQAMFGLAFWDEIFQGIDLENSLNDIPPDLFSGQHFYENRRQSIDRKYLFLSKTCAQKYIGSQLTKHGHKWTRIIYDGKRKDFSYRSVLESQNVTDFLKIINPIVSSKIVYRIATNPNKNRAGLPDYILWKNTDLLFIEVKRTNETVRDSQVQWLSWMHKEGIPVKIICVKGLR